MCVCMNEDFIIIQPRQSLSKKNIEKREPKKKKMSRAFPDGFGHVRRISQQNDPESNLQLDCFVLSRFLYIIRAGLVTQQFVHLGRRRALGSSGGQHEWMEDRDTAVTWCHEILLEVSALFGLPICE